MWFRRDLRLSDHPALNAAATAGAVLPVFVVDHAIWGPSGEVRREYLRRSLDALDQSLHGCLTIRTGNPAEVLPTLAREVGASSVHISADHAPYGSQRDDAVGRTLTDIGVLLERSGSPYAVSPGRVRKADGTPYRVFTPFYRAWCAHGWRLPARVAGDLALVDGVSSDQLPAAAEDLTGAPFTQLPAAGEAAALKRWHAFADEALGAYADGRDRPDLPATSRLSVHLKYGEIHPRTLLAGLTGLADLGGGRERLAKPHEVFRKELAWREFYADVLHHEPQSAREYLREEFTRMQYDTGLDAERNLEAWQQGLTGFPIVDAGMRQLLHEGWMHNRVRMVVASFLVKDLHVEWQQGARWFMQHLVDGDLASNSHGWQWTAGCGTDAAPYFRIFNPVTQGKRFDPDGDYVRHYVPELQHLAGATAHEPWATDEGYAKGYPKPIVDHAEERVEALRRYEEIRTASPTGSAEQ
jgi:deoxyribodipyrimidine photo-lyase